MSQMVCGPSQDCVQTRSSKKLCSCPRDCLAWQRTHLQLQWVPWKSWRAVQS